MLLADTFCKSRRNKTRRATIENGQNEMNPFPGILSERCWIHFVIQLLLCVYAYTDAHTLWLIGLFPPSTGGWLLGVIASVYVYQLEIINNLTLHGKKKGKNKATCVLLMCWSLRHANNRAGLWWKANSRAHKSADEKEKRKKKNKQKVAVKANEKRLGVCKISAVITSFISFVLQKKTNKQTG